MVEEGECGASQSKMTLVRPFFLSPVTEKKSKAICALIGLIHTKPKISSFANYSIRVKNGVHELTPWENI